MKHAKLLLAIVLIIILVFVLVACGEKDPCESGHTAGQWIIDVDATCTTDGIKHQVCSVCGDAINIEIIFVPFNYFIIRAILFPAFDTFENFI